MDDSSQICPEELSAWPATDTTREKVTLTLYEVQNFNSMECEELIQTLMDSSSEKTTNPTNLVETLLIDWKGVFDSARCRDFVTRDWLYDNLGFDFCLVVEQNKIDKEVVIDFDFDQWELNPDELEAASAFNVEGLDEVLEDLFKNFESPQ